MPSNLQTPQQNCIPTIRRHMIETRRNLAPAAQRSNAQQLCLRIMRSAAFRRAERIAVYFALNGEISLAPLIRQALKRNKAVYTPVVLPGFTLRFARLTAATTLVKNRYGIPEPKHKCLIAIKELDLLLCPLVAFDARGNRVGMGGGFYDRALAAIQHHQTPRIWGVAHDLQRCEHIPVASWDIPMHKVITEKSVYTTRFK